MSRNKKDRPHATPEELERLLQELAQLQVVKDYNQGIKVARLALDLTGLLTGTNSLAYADMLFLLAENYRLAGNFKSAKPLFQKALKLYMKKASQNKEAIRTIRAILDPRISHLNPAGALPGSPMETANNGELHSVDLDQVSGGIQPYPNIPGGGSILSGSFLHSLNTLIKLPFPQNLPLPTRTGVSADAAPPEAPSGPVAQTPPPALSLLRYPYMSCPEQVKLHQRFSLIVQLLLELPQDSPDEAPLVLQDTGSPDQLLQIDVVLTARDLIIEGDTNTKTLEVQRNAPSQVRFVLTATRPGTREIMVDFYNGDRHVGTCRGSLLIVGEPVATASAESIITRRSVLELKTAYAAPPPDLELSVKMEPGNDRTLFYELHSSIEAVDCNHRSFDPLVLNAAPFDKIQAVYEELTRMAQLPPEVKPSEKEKRLAALGNDLWDELIPVPMKELYWKFKPFVKSLMITSDEPWIPWEMLKPFRYDEQDCRQDDPFWCQQFMMARWLSGPSAADELPVGPVRPVAPSALDIPAVLQEIKFLRELKQLNPALVALDSFDKLEQVLDWLETGEFSILHFACHGLFDNTAPDNTAITLTDGLLHPSDLHIRFGGARPRPIVFINACHEARLGFNFTGLGGWANRLINARVGSFIGAMWEVSDDLALEFARTFYTALIRDQDMIAEAFFKARERVRTLAPNNSTWLAYVLYADPSAKIKIS